MIFKDNPNVSNHFQDFEYFPGLLLMNYCY